MFIKYLKLSFFRIVPGRRHVELELIDTYTQMASQESLTCFKTTATKMFQILTKQLHDCTIGSFSSAFSKTNNFTEKYFFLLTLTTRTRRSKFLTLINKPALEDKKLLLIIFFCFKIQFNKN